MEACLTTEGDGRAVLLADFSGARMASEEFVTCLDLADASQQEARKALGMSEAAFVVSASDAASLAEGRAQGIRMARENIACGLLLVPVAGGLTTAEAEQRSGLPLCGVLKTQQQIAQVARALLQD